MFYLLCSAVYFNGNERPCTDSLKIQGSTHAVVQYGQEVRSVDRSTLPGPLESSALPTGACAGRGLKEIFANFLLFSF